MKDQLGLSDEWIEGEPKPYFQRRNYRSCQQYIEHQKSKLAQLDLSKYDVEYRDALRARLGRLGVLRPGTTVVCLAARIGTEVKAFLDHGCFAVGIDLNPGEENRYVVHGDFHDVQFADQSIDVVFTNSLDHAFDIHRLLGEIKRVLKLEGRLIIEIVVGTNEGQPPKFYESFCWTAIDDVVRLISDAGFEAVKHEGFDSPWNGRLVMLERRPATGAQQMVATGRQEQEETAP